MTNSKGDGETDATLTTENDSGSSSENQKKLKEVEKVSSSEMVSLKILFNKKKHDIKFPFDNTIRQLKEHLESIINVPPDTQKVMVKGLAKDEKTLRELGVTQGTKIMVVGSTVNDILSVSTPVPQDFADERLGASGSTKEPLCKQKMHLKVLEKGKPDDAWVGIKNCKDSLPEAPISGMMNKMGGKVRLTFKLESDQLWVGTKERTEKITMSTIKNVVSEPIEGHEEYHIMGLQLGPTEASRYWIYWVPSQYIDAIKDAILGKWKLF